MTQLSSYLKLWAPSASQSKQPESTGTAEGPTAQKYFPEVFNTLHSSWELWETCWFKLANIGKSNPKEWKCWYMMSQEGFRFKLLSGFVLGQGTMWYMRECLHSCCRHPARGKKQNYQVHLAKGIPSILNATKNTLEISSHQAFKILQYIHS